MNRATPSMSDTLMSQPSRTMLPQRWKKNDGPLIGLDDSALKIFMDCVPSSPEACSFSMDSVTTSTNRFFCGNDGSVLASAGGGMSTDDGSL
jgi:hypothetical protein